ncbi:MAG: hypothetical protein ACRDTZ_20655 [Pseudonocardiaceae bacterium]
MTDALNFAEIDAQHVELLPARTVLSLFSVGDPGAPAGGAAAPAPAAAAGGPVGGDAGNGGAGEGKAAFLHNWIYVEGDMTNTLTGGAGGAATGGAGSAAPAPAG